MGVLAVDDIANPHLALHMARMARRLTSKVTIYTNGIAELGKQIIETAVEDDFEVDNRRSHC